MRAVSFVAGSALTIMVCLTPNVAALRHDDPCMVNLLGQMVVGDAADAWQGANALSNAGLGNGCTTESIQAANTCGGAVDNSDWFFVNTPAAGVAKSIRVTLSFQFTFCGGPNINSDLAVYFVALGALLPTQLYSSADGVGPGVKICESNQLGTATETVTCTVGADGLLGALGRYYIHKTRVSGTGANLLKVAFV